MRIGSLRIFVPMQRPAKGRVLVCWHRKPWWQWGIWWRPNVDRRCGTYGWRGHRTVLLGRLGELSFQHQY